jgi:hypothetical protein
MTRGAAGRIEDRAAVLRIARLVQNRIAGSRKAGRGAVTTQAAANPTVNAAAKMNEGSDHGRNFDPRASMLTDVGTHVPRTLVKYRRAGLGSAPMAVDVRCSGVQNAPQRKTG